MSASNGFVTHHLKCVFASLFSLLVVGPSLAASPEMISEGRMLFEREWTHTNPVLGSDGLGPLFNAKSCVACHNQGGIGGAGEAKFNAKSVGIDKVVITNRPSPDVVAAAIRGFYPSLVGPGNVAVNSVAVSHHGGTPEFDRFRQLLMDNSLAKFAEEGGPISAAEVRYANSTPLLYASKIGNHEVTIRGRLYQRNTTPLFGSGLIDRVTAKQLESLVRIQERNPEISGRIGTLEDGRFGRFGWRANVANVLDFCDQACAAEVGLETVRKPQPWDPTAADYRNPSVDISDKQIRAMAAFVAALPAPQRIMPDDSHQRAEVLRGEKLFASVGCAACHVPNVGPAQGLYSDLLLHDMGFQSIDLNPADPYIYDATPVTNVEKYTTTSTIVRRTQSDRVMRTYYGRTTVINSTGTSTSFTSTRTPQDSTSSRRSKRPNRRVRLSPMRRSTQFVFDAPVATGDSRKTINWQQNTGQTFSNTEEKDITRTVQLDRFSRTDSGESSYEVREQSTTTTKGFETRTSMINLEIKGTNTAQEWRTPPLWGVRDSAPYMHDGRAGTLLEAITIHNGEGAATRDRFLDLPLPDRHAIIAFLETMVAPQNLSNPPASAL